MSRPLRLEFPGSLWHVTVRGNERKKIFTEDADRRRFVALLGRCVDRFDWILTAYVLMPNHFHLVIQLTKETLSRGMHWLNSNYARFFNVRYERVGHLFQGRFKGFLIDKQTYYLEVLRYVVLNPVRAGLVKRPEEYAWSSHRAMIGEVVAPNWLAVDDVLAQFGPARDIACARYRRFIDDGVGIERKPWDDLVGQIYLGSEAWVEQIRRKVDLMPRADEHPRAQRVIGAPAMSVVISAVAKVWAADEERVRHDRGGVPRMVAAWIGSHEMLTNREIAAGLRIRSSSHISALIGRCDRALSQHSELRAAVDRCLATIGRN